ncbi:MAG: hypothetical protein DCF22_03465 [Leptolyngbya sp.]|nr:MAG: hypothetical protein DCF22_03465 [Leptolyngbya sp.]
MPESAEPQSPKQLSREQRWEIVKALLQRAEAKTDATQAFRDAYPNAPEEMLRTAVFHTYVDGVGAVLDWLVDLELFLEKPNHRLDLGATFHVLYHLYNWYQFQALLPEGRAGVLERLKEMKELLADGDTNAILATVEELESMFEGSRNYPDFQ